MEIDISLCLPRDAETVGIVRDVAVTALRRLGVEGSCVEDIRLALSEACTNVVDHSDADDEYEVRLQVDQDLCQMSVIDLGRGFDVEALLSAPHDPSSPRGRGLMLMRALVDRIDFRSEPEAGTIVHLVKALEVETDSPLSRVRSRNDGGAPLRGSAGPGT